MGKTQNLGHLAHIVSYDTSNNITLPANLTVIGTITGYALSSSLSSYVPTSRTITINGTTYDLSANREWNITSMIYPAAGIALSTGSAWGTSITNNSANWNTAYGWGNHASAGYLTGINSSQVTTALGFTPVTNARTITINGTSYDLSANRSWTITSTETDTLATVTSRGASTSTQVVFSGGMAAWNATTPGLNVGSVQIGAANSNTNFGGAITFAARDGGGGSNAQAGIYVVSDGNYGTRMYFATTDAYVTGSKTAMSISELGIVNITRGALQQGGNQVLHAGNYTSYNDFSNLYASNYFQSITGRAAGNHGYASLFRNTQSGSTNFIPYSFESEYGNHSWGIVARFRINVASQDRPSIQFSAAGGDDRWSVGYCTAADWNFRITQNMAYRNDNGTSDGWGTERFRINTDGNIYSGGIFESGSSLRAPIFYDSNDTTYYGDFASTSYLRHLSVGDVNTSNDGGWNARFNLTGSSHARLDVKSNSDGIITTIYSHTGQGVGRVGTYSNHPLAFMVNGNIAGYAYANYLQGVDSVRAPIFYDSNDTGYYADFNSTSDSAIRLRGGMLCGPNPTWGAYLQVGGNGTNTNYATVTASNGNLHMDSAVGYSMYLNYYHNGTIWLNGSTYSINSDGSYYNGTSAVSNSLSGFDKTNPSFGAVYASNWFRAQGDCGLYSQDYGGHIRRAISSSYGNWETFGYEKNGWSGFSYNYNYILNLMSNTSGDHGFYQQNGNGWTLFYNRSNNCWGIGTDNTYYEDGFRCVKYGSAQFGWTTWSDRRAKENISTITSALDTVLAMRGVYFNYIKDASKAKRVGFIAQELMEVLPEAVRYAEEIDEYNVNYDQIVSVLTEAIKEQNVKITRLESLVEQLTNN